MSIVVPSWRRPHFAQGGGAAKIDLCCFSQPEPPKVVEPGADHGFPAAPWPADLTVTALHLADDASWVQAYLTGETRTLAHEQIRAEADALDLVQHCHRIVGTLPDPPTLEYLQAAWAVVSWLVEHGALAVFDAVQRRWFPSSDVATWPADRLFDVSKHIRLVWDDDAKGSFGSVLHTRGMATFGRPDLVIVDVAASDRERNERYLLGVAEALAEGLLVGQEGSIEPPGWAPLKTQAYYPGQNAPELELESALILPTLAPASEPARSARYQARVSMPDDLCDSDDDLREQIVRLLETGEVDRALPLAERRLAALEATGAASADSLANALESLARVHRAKGDHDAAIAYAGRAIDLVELAYGTKHPRLAASLHTLANIHLQFDELDQAQPLLERGARILEHGGAGHRELLAAILFTLAESCRAINEHAAAVSVFNRVLDDLAPIEPSTPEEARWLNMVRAKALQGLGASFIGLGKLAEAKAALDQSVVCFDSAYAPDHPDFLRSLDDLAHAYEAMGLDGRAADIKARARPPA